jgi:hypothetical protein
MQAKWLALICLAAGWLVLATFFASTGSFLIDELIYSTMIEKFATSGALTIANGYEDHPSASLLVKFLVAGPNGVVPQYPSGYAMLAAPFFMIGDLQGVIFLNALASVLTLVTIYALAKVLFEDRDLALNAALIFGFASFITEYALGIWPHAVSVFFVAFAAYCAAVSVKTQTRSSLVHAALAGLVIALGATIRVDVIIAAPAIGVWMVGAARRPAASFPTFLLGLCLGLILSAWLNHMKFGTWSPITYGHGAGATGFSAYLPLLPLGLVAIGIVISMAFPAVQRAFLGGRGLLIAGAAVGVVLLLPWTRDVGLRLLNGLYVLLVDLQSYPNLGNKLGAQPLEGGPVLLFGLLKKALFQSLPFLGFAILPLARLFQSERRSALALCFLIPAVWFVPFAYFYWYGGMASNMRYFTPTLPFLAILAASGWQEIRTQEIDKRSPLLSTAVLVAIMAIIAVGLWRANPESIVFSAHILISNILLLCAAMIALVWVTIPASRALLRRSAISVFTIGLVWSFYSSAVFDTFVSQLRRINVETANTRFSTIEDNALVIAAQPEMFLFQLRRKAATLAMYEKNTSELDFDLIDDALRRGRPVYAHTITLADAIETGRGADAYIVEPLTPDPEGLYTVKRAAKMRK